MRKGGKFGLRIWAIKKILESLMLAEIDKYEGETIIAHRTNKTMTMGLGITKGLINALARLHYEICESEKAM